MNGKSFCEEAKLPFGSSEKSSAIKETHSHRKELKNGLKVRLKEISERYSPLLLYESEEMIDRCDKGSVIIVACYWMISKIFLWI